MDLDRALNPQCPSPMALSKRWGCISGHTAEFGGSGAQVLSTKGIGVSFCKVAIACFSQCTSGGGFSTPLPRAGTTTVRVASLVDAVAYPTQLLLELVDLPVDGAHLFPALCTLHTFAGSAGECTLVESTALLTQPLLELGGSPVEVAFLFTKGLLSTAASSSKTLQMSHPSQGNIGLAAFKETLVQQHHSLLHCHALHTMDSHSVSRHDWKLMADNVVGGS